MVVSEGCYAKWCADIHPRLDFRLLCSAHFIRVVDVKDGGSMTVMVLMVIADGLIKVVRVTGGGIMMVLMLEGV